MHREDSLRIFYSQHYVKFTKICVGITSHIDSLHSCTSMTVRLMILLCALCHEFEQWICAVRWTAQFCGYSLGHRNSRAYLVPSLSWTMRNIYVIFEHFITARMQSAVLAMIDSVCLTVCLTVCLSQSGIMPKRFHLRSCGLHWRIAHDSSFLMVNLTEKFQREHRERGRRMREGSQKCSKNRQFLANKSPYLRNGAR